jgi:hypothetical protein
MVKINNEYSPVDIPNENHKRRLIDQYEIVNEEQDHYIVQVPPREFYAVRKEYFEHDHVLKFPHDRSDTGYKSLPLKK